MAQRQKPSKTLKVCLTSLKMGKIKIRGGIDRPTGYYTKKPLRKVSRSQHRMTRNFVRGDYPPHVYTDSVPRIEMLTNFF